MFILFDTNVWISELALNSAAGAAVRFYVHQRNATVVVPEVVRLELERNLTRRLCELAAEIKSNHRQLLAVFGTLKEVIVPSESEITQRVSEIISQLDVPTKCVELSLDAARSSFLKTVNKVPPSDKTQEFKDGVIWAHCLDLLTEDDVYFVTNDKAFYDKRGLTRGLAKNLLEEAGGCRHQLQLFPDLGELLQDIRSRVEINKQELVSAFFPGRSENINRLLARTGFALDDTPRVEFDCYATEVATQLYIEFTITFQCSDISGQNRPDAVLELRGDGSFETSKREFLKLRSHGEKLTYSGEEGQQKVENFVLIPETVVVGHRSVHHTGKYELS